MPAADVLEAIAYVGGLSTVPITKNLSQGSAPPYGVAVRDAGFDTLVLCAVEFQPPAKMFTGVDVVRCPIDDVDMTKTIWTLATATARDIAARIRRGQRALVTCAFGWNRSGLIDTMVLHELNGISGRQAIKRIHAVHGWSLYNQSFVKALENIQATRKR